jgi:hypothetical protein
MDVLSAVCVYSFVRGFTITIDVLSAVCVYSLVRRFATVRPMHVGRDSFIGIATRYGVDGPEIESQWERDFPHWPRPTPRGPPSSLYSGYRVFFPGIKRLWCGVNHPPPPSAEIKEIAELYLLSLCLHGLLQGELYVSSYTLSILCWILCRRLCPPT